MRSSPNSLQKTYVHSSPKPNSGAAPEPKTHGKEELFGKDAFEERASPSANPLYKAFQVFSKHSLERTLPPARVNVGEVELALHALSPQITAGTFDLNRPLPPNNETTFPGQLPLGVAAILADTKLFTVLHGVHGISPTATDKDGQTVLMRAVTGAIRNEDSQVLDLILADAHFLKTLNLRVQTLKGPRENAMDLALSELLRDKNNLFILDVVKQLKAKGAIPALEAENARFWAGDLKRRVQKLQSALEILDFARQ